MKDPSSLSRCGLSRQKAAYLTDLAAHFLDGRVRTRKLADMNDDEIIDALTCVNGIGRWTVEMFLIFVLNRPDVLPVDDLGLREAMRGVYGLKARPGATELTAVAERWRPYRTVATWYLWRGLSEARARKSQISGSKSQKRSRVQREQSQTQKSRRRLRPHLSV